jgi:hypothetical protein
MKNVIFTLFFVFGFCLATYAQSSVSGQTGNKNQTSISTDTTSKPNAISSSSLKVLYNADKFQQAILIPDSTSANNTVHANSSGIGSSNPKEQAATKNQPVTADPTKPK